MKLSHTEAACLLRRYGMKSTTPARGIVRLLARFQAPATAKRIHDRRLEPPADLATIHRILRKGARLGLFRELRLQDRSRCYELITDPTRPHHLICTRCKSIQRFHSCFIAEIGAAAEAETGFHVQSHSVQLYGFCERCGRNKGGVKRPVAP